MEVFMTETTMTTSGTTIRRPWLLMVMDHNPCYLLSGMCMLLGCGLLNWALYDKGGDVRKMLTLLAVVNVYELLLVSLGLVLIKRSAFLRDGRILLGLEAVFLVDITFINGVISTVSASAGMLTGLTLLVLSSAKAWVIFRALRLPMARRMWAFLTLTIAAVVLGPAVYKQIAWANRGFMKPIWIYVGWCMAGGLLVAGAMIWRWRASEDRTAGERSPERALGWFYVMLAFVSLLGHQYATGWVYAIRFEWVYLAPVVLGMAAVVDACRGWVVTAQTAVRLQVAMLAMAIWMSVDQPLFLQRALAGDVVFSPLRFVLLGGAALCLWLLWRDHRRMFAYVAAVCVLSAMLGPSVLAMWMRVQEIGHVTATTAWRLWPRTMLEWGVTAVGGSFVLLGAGAGWTLMRERIAKRHRDEVAEAAA
jgi:hypothetical protein